MANEWVEVGVGEISSKVAMGPFGSDIKAENFSAFGVPVIRGGNLTSGRFNPTGFVYVTEEKADALANANAFPGDLVFTHRGTLGQVGLIPAEPFKRYVVSQSQMKLTCLPARAAPEFLFYYFRSPVGQHALLANTSQTGVPAISRPITSLKAIRLKLPPLHEQHTIGRILGALDDKIELNRRSNETLEAMARALFQDWFIDFGPIRAKREGREPYLASDLWSLFPGEFDGDKTPAGWIRSTLGNEVRKANGLIQTGPFGSQLHASDYAADGIPVVMPKDLVDRRISTSSVARIPPVRAEPLTRHSLSVGDIVYSRRGDVERFAIVSRRENGWLCGTGCLLVRPGPNWKSTAFLAEMLDHPSSRAWIVRHAVGATMPNLNTGILGDVPVLVPTEPLLIAFEKICSSWQKKKEAANVESEIIADLRDTLLPKLISGELRVRDAERYARKVL